MQEMIDDWSVTSFESVPGIDPGTCVTFKRLLRGGRVVEMATAF